MSYTIYIYIYFFKIQQRSYLVHKSLTFVRSRLESTDAAPEVPHPRPTRDAASDTVAHVSVRVCVFFFFFLGFAPTWLDSRQIGFDSCQTGLIRPKSGPYRSYQVVSAGSRYGQNMPETAEICRNRP